MKNPPFFNFVAHIFSLSFRKAFSIFCKFAFPTNLVYLSYVSNDIFFGKSYIFNIPTYFYKL